MAKLSMTEILPPRSTMTKCSCTLSHSDQFGAPRRSIVAAGTHLEVWALAAFDEERQRVQEAALMQAAGGRSERAVAWFGGHQGWAGGRLVAA